MPSWCKSHCNYADKFTGDHTARVPPVPIPNTEVKPRWADGTARAGVWEIRRSPVIIVERSAYAGLFLRHQLSAVKRGYSRYVVFKYFLLIFLLSNPIIRPSAISQSPIKQSTVAQCKDVSFHASYLAEEKPGQGPGFLLSVQNNTNYPIEMANPIPLSIHWYAFSAGHWLWRASSGSGGSLVNALQEKGLLFAAHIPAKTSLSIPHHKTYTWTSFDAQAPTLMYRPGCEHCTYSHEEQYRAVLAYALLPVTADGQVSRLLSCGLRSTPVVMPPLQIR